MTKQSKQAKSVEAAEERVDDVVEAVEAVEVAETVRATDRQAAEKSSDFAKKSSDEAALHQDIQEEKVQEQPSKQKSRGGVALALLALLVAIGVGGVGHYLANSKFAQVENQLQELAKRTGSAAATAASIEMPNFDAEKAQLAQLGSDYRDAVARITQLESGQNSYTQQIKALQAQVQKLGLNPAAESATWLFSEADFLLNNALRKVVLDNDIDTAKSLLIEADNVLSQISDPKVLAVREAVKRDLSQLSGVNVVDQHNLMQRLAGLANLVDDMQLAVNDAQTVESSDVSDSVTDWQKNLEKSADSFLNHFIRISDKNSVANEKVFIAPNQEIYLRENIRLRLQIAMMAVPRQQNDLYKQSLEAVGSWVRSYFDVENANVKRFLKETDDLAEQSIYIDAPSRLQSLDLLAQQLNRSAKPISKIQLEEEKALSPLPSEQTGSEQPAAQ